MQRRAFHYDREKTEVMKRILGAGSNCIDVGAYRGEVLEELLRLAPRDHHFAFEPLPENHAYLTRRFESVTVLDIALSDHAGIATFQFIRSRPARSGLLRVEYPEEEDIEELVVRADTLDNVIP
ncbi:MAG TPA: FkbM family methyltransferase, partial [Dehalococcoidia bacterium]